MTQDEFDDYINRLWGQYDEKSAELVRAERQARESGTEGQGLLWLRAEVATMESDFRERGKMYGEGHFRHGYPSDYDKVMGVC